MKNKNYLTATIFLFTIIHVQSQITLDNSDFPLPGVQYGRYWGFAPGIGSPGPNQAYDFSNGFFMLADTLRYLHPSQTPFAPQHPGATIALPMKDDNFQTINYYNYSMNAFWQTGITLIGDFGNGWDTLHGNYLLQATDTILNNQYTYGYNDMDYSIMPIPVDNNITAVLHYITYINVDGYGSLATPLNSFNDVLRIKRVIYEIDSIFAGNLFLQESRDTLYEYWYYPKNVRHPVVIAHTNALDSIQYLELINIPPIIFGCTDPQALNYNPMATADDSSCYYCNPIAYTITPDQDICPGDSLNLLVNGGVSWLWNTGNMTNSILVQPDSDEVYSVFIYDSAGCTEQASVQITVHQPVSSAFWVNPALLNTDDSIPFVNLSENATAWFWDFDDNVNGTSTLENPYHQYSTTGSKTVMLAASNTCFSDTSFQTLDIALNTAERSNLSSSLSVFPNPGRNDAEISFELNMPSPVELSLTDLLGHKKLLLNNVMMSAGAYRYNIDELSGEISPGMYMIRLKTDGKTSQLKWIKSY